MEVGYRVVSAGWEREVLVWSDHYCVLLAGRLGASVVRDCLYPENGALPW